MIVKKINPHGQHLRVSVTNRKNRESYCVNKLNIRSTSMLPFNLSFFFYVLIKKALHYQRD